MPSLPKLRIPVHVFAFSLACLPGVAYAYYYKKNVKSDEEFEKILHENYGSKIQASRDKRADITRMVQSIKNPGSDAEMEKKFEEVLYAGKSEAKRHYAVDSSLYGTEEGERKRQAAEEERKRKEEDRKSRKNKKLVEGGAGGASAAKHNKGEMAAKSSEVLSTDESQGRELDSPSSGSYKKRTVGLAAVGAVAVGVGLLFGGNRSQ